MTDRTPAQIANAAAEDIRALNHALYADIEYPGDAYSIVGNLSHLASMLPQALTMTLRAVQKLEAGRLRSDRNTLPIDLAGTYGGLEQAARIAGDLYQALNVAHQSLGHIGHEDGE